MVSISSLSSIEGWNYQRLLRRESIRRMVLLGKAIAIVLMLVALWFLVSEVMSDLLGVRTELQALRNEIHARLARVDQPSGMHPEKGNYKVIVTRNLLGPLTAQGGPSQTKTAAKPVSNAQLALIGTFLTDGEEPYAIIENQKKNLQDVFNINDTVFGEAKVKAIYSDRVEIERNGQREMLMLDDLALNSAPQFKDGVAIVDSNQYFVQEAELDKALENLPLLLTQARAVPYFKDGKSIGLRLFAIKSDSIFEKIGLKNADILKAVNGNSLGDLSQAIKLFEQLKQERSITVKLERNNEEKEFKYEIR